MKRVIYGAGKFGRLLYDYFFEENIIVDYFVQSKIQNESEIFGVPIISFDELKELKDDISVYIALKSHFNARQIKFSFEKIKDRNISIYYMGEFIEENLVHPQKSYLSSGLFYCNICGNKVESFMPDGIKNDLFKKKHIIGGGWREKCICPFCGFSDRERWLQIVVKEYTDIESIEGRILHFAPERNLSDIIMQNAGVDYYTGDIVPGKAMNIIDITDIHFKDEVFDYVICNHVMEHIIEEERAVSEIKRVLKPQGKWIFSFPVCTDIETTYEDYSIVEPNERLNAFGQEDHVRLYGMDYQERFSKYGFRLKVYSPNELLNSDEVTRMGLIGDDIIIIAIKD